MMKAILFDMDGVLVEVTHSYRMTIKKVVKFFLNREINYSMIQSYKDRGGLNNDWDLTEYILMDSGLRVERQKIIDVFQEIYIGKNYDGLIRNEQWLLNPCFLKEIQKKFKTGIVTGRPRNEACYILKRFNVQDYFNVLITMNDIPPDKAKPDPYGINLALNALDVEEGIYLGDTIDDMIAARMANVIPIGVARQSRKSVSQKDRLFDNGARIVLTDINDIMEVLE